MGSGSTVGLETALLPRNPTTMSRSIFILGGVLPRSSLVPEMVKLIKEPDPLLMILPRTTTLSNLCVRIDRKQGATVPTPNIAKGRPHILAFFSPLLFQSKIINQSFKIQTTAPPSFRSIETLSTEYTSQ